MNAEQYVNRWAVELNGDFDKLAPLFRAAMAEARALALREAIALIEKWWPDANEEIRVSGDACVTLAMRDVADELRKLAGGAT